MKTYEDRMISIQKKAKRKKFVRTCIKTAASTLCLVAIIIGLMHIPYGSFQVGVSPTHTSNNRPTDIFTTVPTYPTLPTMPSSTFGPPIYPPDLDMDLDRIALIEDSWAKENKAGFAQNMKFCHAAAGVDGIRHYYSFMKEDYKGQNQRYDILYIPCQALPVATEFTFSGHTFRSRNGFGLYVFSSQHLEALDVTLNLFIPLVEYINSSTIEETALLVSVQMHNLYEEELYGSFLKEMPKVDPADDLLRLKAAWLVNFGQVPAFEDVRGPRYYGTFSGYAIVFEQTNLTVVQTQTIGGQSFTHGYSFVLYAIKDWQLYLLEDVYAQGLISQEDIVQLAQVHRGWGREDTEMAALEELFADVDSWYNRAIVSQYSDPTQIKLELLFYVGFEGESRDPTDKEWEQLKDERGFNINMDLIRLPVDRMNEVLMDLFGITLEDMDTTAFENLVYLESTNCYYHMVTDFECVDNFHAESMQTNEDGSISLYYTANWDDTLYAVTLMVTDDGYRIISNMKAE